MLRFEVLVMLGQFGLQSFRRLWSGGKGSGRGRHATPRQEFVAGPVPLQASSPRGPVDGPPVPANECRADQTTAAAQDLQDVAPGAAPFWTQAGARGFLAAPRRLGLPIEDAVTDTDDDVSVDELAIALFEECGGCDDDVADVIESMPAATVPERVELAALCMPPQAADHAETGPIPSRPSGPDSAHEPAADIRPSEPPTATLDASAVGPIASDTTPAESAPGPVAGPAVHETGARDSDPLGSAAACVAAMFAGAMSVEPAPNQGKPIAELLAMVEAYADSRKSAVETPRRPPADKSRLGLAQRLQRVQAANRPLAKASLPARSSLAILSQVMAEADEPAMADDRSGKAPAETVNLSAQTPRTARSIRRKAA
jgi:hypothetical protein